MRLNTINNVKLNHGLLYTSKNLNSLLKNIQNCKILLIVMKFALYSVSDVDVYGMPM